MFKSSDGYTSVDFLIEVIIMGNPFFEIANKLRKAPNEICNIAIPKLQPDADQSLQRAIDNYYGCIEYDGEQHFKPVKFGTQSYEDAVRKHEYIKKHDEMKNAFCKDNSINLIRIPYYEFEDLEYYLFDKFTSIGIISEIKSN